MTWKEMFDKNERQDASQDVGLNTLKAVFKSS